MASSGRNTGLSRFLLRHMAVCLYPSGGRYRRLIYGDECGVREMTGRYRPAGAFGSFGVTLPHAKAWG